MTPRKSRRASRKFCAMGRRCLWKNREKGGRAEKRKAGKRESGNKYKSESGKTNLSGNCQFNRQSQIANYKFDMAGHSRWAKVKHFKGGIDAKRGKIFSKLGREITVATKIGGGDPDMNPRLRMVLLRCRAASMPNENIERAIKKGTGAGETVNFEDLTYEIYAPHGVALLVEVSTDNRNRTASEIRSLVTKAGGSIATPNSVSRLFQRKGQIIVAREAANEDQLMEVA